LPRVLMRDRPARLFHCARCRIQVLVCSHCDRGQRYCASGCAMATRRELQGAAGKLYQQGCDGRANHAIRMAAWRTRRAEKVVAVTHQGSQTASLAGVLVAPSPTTSDTSVPAPCEPCTPTPCARAAVPAASALTPMNPATWRCHWCFERCKSRARLGFVRYGLCHGNSP
jgi:hypothetical protein